MGSYDELIKAAVEVRENAYAPYSEFKVGAALLTKDGKIFTGCNVENAVYQVFHAESVAVCKAISENHNDFEALVLVTQNSEALPCGSCRQFLMEFSPYIKIVVADPEGNVKLETSLKEILPLPFTNGLLKK